MLRKIFLSISAALPVILCYAQDSTKSLTFSGSVDAYYRYNFSGKANNYTSFTNSQSSFELGMATIKADATALSGKVAATADLGFGRRAEEFNYNDGQSNFASGYNDRAFPLDSPYTTGKNGFLTLAAVKQLYITYAPSSKVKFTLGKFTTHVGYELLDAPSNRNYSMSYMFTNGPFFHTGLKADINAGPVAFMIGVSNFTDQSTSTTNVKTLLGQVSGGSKNGNFKVYLNYVGFFGSKAGLNPTGLKSLNQVDLVATGVVNSKFNIGFNATIQSRNLGTTSGSWFGSALYLNFDPTSTLGITLRSEFIGDDKLIYYGTKSIFANTLSFNCKVGPLTIIPELRFESAQSNLYVKNNGAGTKSTAAGLLAAVYKF
ncbi:MAG: outer membrane beta-barrel protein [Ferruginibacter sp.]